MADLDLDELERLIAAASPRPWRIEPLLRDYLAGAVDGENRNVADMRRADAWLVVALANAAPALIAAARAAQHRGETLGRVAEAVGYPRDAHYGDVLGRIDEIVAERDRLRAAVDGVLADVARWREHTEARTRGGQHVGTGGEIGQLSHSTAEYLERTLGRHVGGESREVDRLRALCRETHAALDGVVDVLGVMECSCECEHDQGEGHDETCWRCEICRVYSLLVTSCLLDRLRAAGGGT